MASEVILPFHSMSNFVSLPHPSLLHSLPQYMFLSVLFLSSCITSYTSHSSCPVCFILSFLFSLFLHLHHPEYLFPPPLHHLFFYHTFQPFIHLQLFHTSLLPLYHPFLCYLSLHVCSYCLSLVPL